MNARQALLALAAFTLTVSFLPAATADPLPPAPFTPTPSSFMQAKAQLAALRDQVKAAEQAVAEAAAKQEAALAVTRDAQVKADQAQAQAGAAQAQLDQMASAMYRSGGLTPVSVAGGLLESGSVTNLLAMTETVGLAAQDQTTQVNQLQTVVDYAVLAQQQAQAAAAEAAAAVWQSNAVLATLNEKLDAYTILVRRMQGVSSLNLGAQDLVGPEGCPLTPPNGVLRDGSDQFGAYRLCADSVALAATPAAALAVKYAFKHLGDPYACKGVGRLDPHRYDCSSFVSRAYYEGAGVPVAGTGWAPSTRNMIPWDGVPLGSWYSYVSPENARPGDLVLFRSCVKEPCAYQHVAMLLADGFMVHTNSCGDVSHVAVFPGYTDPGFLLVRRVMQDGVPGPQVMDPRPTTIVGGKDADSADGYAPDIPSGGSSGGAPVVRPVPKVPATPAPVASEPAPAPVPSSEADPAPASDPAAPAVEEPVQVEPAPVEQPSPTPAP